MSEEITAEEEMFSAFARFHPVECYAAEPERFWEYFSLHHPNVSREQMEAVMRQAEQEAT